MKLSVGTIVRNEITNETGRIVRIATNIQRPGYIVITADKVSGREIEALWQPREVKEVPERVRNIRGLSENSS
jgi:hypothetical protein